MVGPKSLSAFMRPPKVWKRSFATFQKTTYRKVQAWWWPSETRVTTSFKSLLNHKMVQSTQPRWRIPGLIHLRDGPSFKRPCASGQGSIGITFKSWARRVAVRRNCRSTFRARTNTYWIELRRETCFHQQLKTFRIPKCGHTQGWVQKSNLNVTQVLRPK